MAQVQFNSPSAASIADNYERYFVPAIGAPMAHDLTTKAALKPGEKVLDIACGTGVVARLARAAVGPSGSVAGLDGHPGMLATARAQPAGSSIDWYESGMESMPLPDAAFDVVLCQMGLQFVTDKLAAVREMHRVLRPGGRLLVNVPGPTPAPFEIMAEVFSRHIGEKPAAFVRIVFSLHDKAVLNTFAEQAGFSEFSTSTVTKNLQVPAPAEFFSQYIQSTPLADLFADADASLFEGFSAEVAEQWQGFATTDGRHMHLDVGVLTLTAHK